MKLTELYLRLQSLAIFRSLLSDPVLEALVSFLGAGDTAQAVSRYAEFVCRLYATGKRTLAGYIQHIVTNDENAYIRMIGAGATPWPEMEDVVTRELEVFQAVADLTPESLREAVDWEGYLPRFAGKQVDIPASYRQRCANIHRYGYGIYAKYIMFYLDEGNRIVPVINPDQTRLSSLVDYKREQKIILDNTLALLEGKPAANILLTGDAGTGKSSTVKAVVNELHDRGLRILEVRKEQLHAIPAILDALNTNPLKFILFIDDLSFTSNDDNFAALKAILEGSVGGRAQNIAVYATSNRRHLIKETMTDRTGDDIHESDTRQELMSLSARFGLTVTFASPDRDRYLYIVRELAKQYGVDLDEHLLAVRSEAFAIRMGGRSARVAKQFIELCKSGVQV